MSTKTLEQLGISQTNLKKLESLGIRTPWDLILHMPLRYEDETYLTPIQAAPTGQVVLVEGVVCAQEVQFRPRKQLLVQIEDPSGVLVLRFIHFYPSQQKQMAVGAKIRAFGEIRHGYFGDEMVHPKIKVADEGEGLAESLTPIYSTVKGLGQPTLARIIHKSLSLVDLDDTLPDEILKDYQLLSFEQSVRFLHQPPAELSIAALSDGRLPAWQRLKFDELLAQQLSMRLAYERRQNGQAPVLNGQGKLVAQLLASVGFELTSAQKKVWQEIVTDLAQKHPMHRLLQGDVGSGKTIIAAIAALIAIESGYQVALMAPTEILAEQHYQKFKKWLTPLGLEVQWLAGSLRKKEKELIKESIASGSTHIAVGTHALFQDDVVFTRLGLAIIDEQHRFGVAQRLALFIS